MANAKISDIEALTRTRLVELTPRYWTSAEMTEIIVAGIKDLWRAIVDLKQEHFLYIDNVNVTYQADDTKLSGVPQDVHKVYLIEPRDTTVNAVNHGLIFQPRDYNHKDFQLARTRAGIDPANDTLYYAISAAGAPVGAPVIHVAPKVNSAVNISFCYVPTLGPLDSDDFVPIPGECDNALVAWTVAYARAKESEDRAPDPQWMTIYGTEKMNLLESLGLRQYHEPSFVDALFQEYW